MASPPRIRFAETPSMSQQTLSPNIEQSDPRASYISDTFSYPASDSTHVHNPPSPPPHTIPMPTIYAPDQPGYAQYPPARYDDDDDDQGVLGDPNETFATLRKRKTTITRRKKTVKLSQNGNFVIKQRVPEEVLRNVKFTKGEEFESMRYTAATCGE